jgi:hypothetical protein
MADYTPPSGDSVNFSFTGGYSAPEGDAVHLLFGAVADVDLATNSPSRSTIYSDTGFDRTFVSWTSSITGEYRIEMGGSGANTGALLVGGVCIADQEMINEITYTDITTASGYEGAGEYRVNIYVKSSDDIWNVYE